MCAIIGSKNLEMLKELVSLNSYRGSHSYSLSLFNTTTGILSILKKKIGVINLKDFVIPTNNYAIVHVQAPTTEARSDEAIHPAVIASKFVSWPEQALWHNGIIKAECVKKNATFYNTSWDTMQILKGLGYDKNWSTLGELDGSFSCLYYDNNDLSLYIFRNEISPLFYDKDMNISSTQFAGSIETPYNEVLKMNLKDCTLKKVYEFKTVENPYFFAE